MSDINDLEKSFMEQKQYSDASFKVIVDLQKKLDQLKQENSNLQMMLSQHTPSITSGNDGPLGISSEQLICEVQIKLLKDQAIYRELTKEEAQKLQIYVDILQKVKRKSGDEINVDSIDTSELINLVEIK